MEFVVSADCVGDSGEAVLVVRTKITASVVIICSVVLSPFVVTSLVVETDVGALVVVFSVLKSGYKAMLYEVNIYFSFGLVYRQN